MTCLEAPLLRIAAFGAFLGLAAPDLVNAAQQVEVTNTPLPVEVTKTPLPVTAVDTAAKNRFKLRRLSRQQQTASQLSHLAIQQTFSLLSLSREPARQTQPLGS
jgi:hypothetical protein